MQLFSNIWHKRSIKVSLTGTLLIWWVVPLIVMQFFAKSVPFQYTHYLTGSHHFQDDTRLSGNSFNLIKNLAVWDAQWYLKIASDGYTLHPDRKLIHDRKNMDAAMYAYFPVYPLFIATINTLTHNIFTAALVGVLITAIIVSFLWFKIISHLSDQPTAYKSFILLLSLPTSLFLRSYFTESLQLIFLLISVFATYSKKYTLLTCVAVISFFIKGNNIALIIFTLIWMFIDRKHAPLRQWILTLLIMVTSAIAWLIFNFHQTGDPLFFIAARRAWNDISAPFGILINPFIIGQTLPLPFQHFFHISHIDSLVALGTGILLLASYKRMLKPLWLLSFLIWVSPLATTDIMSFSRYQLINFPLVIYLAKYLPSKIFALLVAGMFVITLYLSPFFINWHWFG